MQDATQLPKEVDACHALIAELNSRLESREILVQEQSQTLVELQQSREQLSEENEDLKLTITKLLQRLSGHRRERVVDHPDQLKLDFGDDPAARDALADAALEAEKIIAEYTVRRTSKPKPQRSEKLPDHIPRYEVTVDVEPEEKHCPEHGERQVIGYDLTETLEFVPPKLRIRVTKYPKYACPQQPTCGIAQADRPTSLVEGNRYDGSVAVEIIAAKYGYHLPFYRQQDLFAGSGWTPSRSTLLNVLSAAEDVLRPFAEYYRQQVLESHGLGCDETTVRLIRPAVIPPIDPDNPRSARIHEVVRQAHEDKAPSITARMWAYRAFDVPINVFDFTISRHRDGPDSFLENFTGTLMADCWSGFQKIELRTNARIVRGACWAHARRKVLEGRNSHPHLASILLAMICELYDIEDRGKLLSAEARLALRQNESRRVLDQIRSELDSEAMSHVLPKSVFAEALGYLRNHWNALQVFLTDARMPIDNNDVEQLMRHVALGRKNWLFLGSIEAGTRAATLLTLISTALRNDLDVSAYLNDVLRKLLAGSTDYHSLRADIWKAAHPEAVRTYRADERQDAADRRHHRRAQRRIVEKARNGTR